jgi:cellulose synthase/poly-beta-1,6-N-acetylglucosamine synthase-like glycosyltransferase
MTVNTRVIKLMLARRQHDYVKIEEGRRLQVIPSLSALPYCQKHQSAAFIADAQILVVWEDDPQELLNRAQHIQDTMMRLIWGQDQMPFQNENENMSEKKKAKKNEEKQDVKVMEWETMLEDGVPEVQPKRPIILLQPAATALTLALVITALGAGFRNVAKQIAYDQNYLRIAFVACVLPQAWLALFFFQALVGNLFQICGPTSQVQRNTKFYSGKAPVRISHQTRGSLPHVTIQMPVYKEGLHAVIEPTIRSIKAAISSYEMQGGTANIFVNDDGMQLLPHHESKARQDFYDEHSIGWVARPKHNPKSKEGKSIGWFSRPKDNPEPKEPGERIFTRAGKFKKASNMNYGMYISVKAEGKLENIERHEGWTQRNENKAFSEAVKEILEELEGEAWSDGNIRLGDYILLIDSDTRVPTDCLLEAVSEMEQSPQVAIIQYGSGVMNVTDSFFEKGITFFTNLIYTQIQYAVANGDVAPFVGHNAVLRWSAMQQIAYECKEDKREKYWSEETVSEDFDMSLRLQTAGYIVRYGAYKDKGFKEGVSLTVYDELARWEKYDAPTV